MNSDVLSVICENLSFKELANVSLVSKEYNKSMKNIIENRKKQFKQLNSLIEHIENKTDILRIRELGLNYFKSFDKFYKWLSINNKIWIIINNCCICKGKLINKCLSTNYKNISCKSEKENCNIVIGKCNHIYHKDCINWWLTRRDCCPLDNNKWSVDKILH